MITRPSKCHRVERGWTPEYGSPLNPIKDVKSKGKKYHWRDSSCQQVRGYWSFLNVLRIVNGQEFNDLPVEKKCLTCEEEFQRS